MAIAGSILVFFCFFCSSFYIEGNFPAYIIVIISIKNALALVSVTFVISMTSVISSHF